MNWHGAIYQDATGYFLAFEEERLPQRAGVKQICVSNGELEEIIPEMERQVEQLNRENKIWCGAVFRDETGYFAAFQKGKHPSRPGAKLIYSCEGDFFEAIEAIEETVRVFKIRR